MYKILPGHEDTWRHSEKSAGYNPEEAFTRTQSCSHPDLGLPTSRNFYHWEATWFVMFWDRHLLFISGWWRYRMMGECMPMLAFQSVSFSKEPFLTYQMGLTSLCLPSTYCIPPTAINTVYFTLWGQVSWLINTCAQRCPLSICKRICLKARAAGELSQSCLFLARTWFSF